MRHAKKPSARSFGTFAVFSCLVLCLCAATALAQSSTTAAVVGTVTDATSASVPGAVVELQSVDTNAVTTAKTNDSGEYIFPNVTPGKYRVTVKHSGFKPTSVADLTIEVNRSYSVPVRLEVGTDTQVVEVQATASVQLQTTDSQIGNSVSSDAIMRLPTLQRNATELLGLQPGAVPVGNGIMMRVSGAIDDQNTVTIDGIDVTQNIVATNTSIPTGTDSVEELRVTTANPNANFDRASGAQMTLQGRHGTNEFHGTLYEYLQNSALNANTWDSNRARLAKPAIKDNRYGGSFGGPIKKNKTFIFGNFEERRYNAVTQITRTVPTSTLRQGIIQFRNPSGNIDQFNLATAAVCGPNGNGQCDPRGLGMSPTVAAQFKLMPLPNFGGVGDGLNTSGFTANIPTPLQSDFGVVRLDHYITSKLTFNSSYTVYKVTQIGAGDVSIENGNAISAVSSPQYATVLSASLTWTISPTLVNVTRFGFVRDDNINQATSPTLGAAKLNVPGSQSSAGDVALLIGSGVSSFIDSPIDMDTQRARYQASYADSFQWIDDVTKIWGKHTVQFGGNINKIPFTHVRADKVVGSLTSIVATVDQGSFAQIPTVDAPLTCGGAVTSNCITSANATNWNRYYASLLGIVDNVGVLATRNSALQPNPLGTPLISRTNQYGTYMYLQDSWHIKPHLTLSFGLSYGWQTSPTEANQQQTIMIDTTTNQPIVAAQYLSTKLQSALAGQGYNPTVGFVPVAQAHHPLYNVDYGDLAPRISLAWSPNSNNGFLSKVLGQDKSVIRGGYAIVYDRSNTVQSVEIPILGVGFDQNISINGPQCNATGAGGKGCLPGNGNPASAFFRVGVDGTLPLPVATAATSPVTPGTQAEVLSFQLDPNMKVGRSHNVDLSVQRQFAGGFVVEAAYIGRFARRLPQAINLNQDPYMFVDPASKQSFAQAFDGVATALRNGQSAPTESWFENQLPGLAAAKGTATATAYIVSQNSANIKNGNLSQVFLNLGNYRRTLGLQPYSNDQALMEFMRTSIGESNYHAAAISVNRRESHGLTLGANYTFSRALDNNLSNQNNAGFYGNSFYPGVDYGPSNFDRTHVFNAYAVYDLPAGKGHRLNGNRAVNQVIGGWYVSGIGQMWSGLPLLATEGNPAYGGGLIITPNTAEIGTNGIPSTGLNSNVAGCTNGVAAAGAGSGSGLNIFSDPCTAFSNFRPILLASDNRSGRANPFRGLPFRNLDMSLGKNTAITERVSLRFSADFFNLFNHTNFANPVTSLQNPGNFGVVTNSFTPPNRVNGARGVELGLRILF